MMIILGWREYNLCTTNIMQIKFALKQQQFFKFTRTLFYYARYDMEKKIDSTTLVVQVTLGYQIDQNV